MGIDTKIIRTTAAAAMAWLLLLTLTVTGAPPEDTANNLHKNLKEFERLFPLQKVYLHTDKDEYLCGEKIWFKAYVVNARTLQPDTMSKNLHVKFTSARGDLVSVLLLELNQGRAHGNIVVPDSLMGGNYQISGFTDWMKNFDPSLVFRKDLFVHNTIEQNFARRSDLRHNRRFNRELEQKQQQMQFAFFPEGGNLVAGKENKIAFKAANSLGTGIAAEGIIYDDQGNIKTRFQTAYDGMGAFRFTPTPGNSYTTAVTFENGESVRIDLPEASSENISLSAQQKDNYIEIYILSNLSPFNTPLFLSAHIQGKLVYFESVNLEETDLRRIIPTESMNGGVCKITLLTVSGFPVSERLVFINNHEIKQAEIIDYHKDQTGSTAGVVIELNHPEENDHDGYSIAVLDTDKNISTTNIATELLLLSEISYRTEEAGFLMDIESEATTEAIDLILMTHGWKRFDIQKIAEGSFPEINYGFPEGMSISGQVLPRASGRKTGQVNVELAIFDDDPDITKTAKYYNTVTDEEGLFSFSGIRQEGTFTAGIRTDSRQDQRIMEVELHEREYTVEAHAMNKHTRTRKATTRGDDWQRVSRPETALESKRFFKPGGQEGQSLYGQADQIIYFDDIRDQVANMMDVLRTRVRGLRIIDGEITLRGVSSVMFSNEPIFMIDEVVVDRSAFLNLNVRQVDQLAVLSGSQAAILGSRGTNGALLAYTLRGESLMERTYEFTMQGYHKPEEDFSSRINTDLYAKTQMDRTLFWNPTVVFNNNRFEFSFDTDPHVRNLRLILQGIDEKGRITFTDILLENGER